MKLLLGCYAVAVTVVAGCLGYFIVTDPIPRYQRFPQGDSLQGGPSMAIVCTAYSNRPNQEFTSSHPGDYYGLRIVSDCLTVDPRK